MELRRALQHSERQIDQDESAKEQLRQTLHQAERFRRDATAQLREQDRHIRTLSAALALERQARDVERTQSDRREAAEERTEARLRRDNRALQVGEASVGLALNRTRKEESQLLQEL